MWWCRRDDFAACGSAIKPSREGAQMFYKMVLEDKICSDEENDLTLHRKAGAAQRSVGAPPNILHTGNGGASDKRSLVT